MLNTGIRSLEKAMSSIIPCNVRSRLSQYMRVSQCDTQSSCAQQARELIQIIIQDIKINGSSSSNSSKNKGLSSDISKECRGSVYAFLDGNDGSFYLSKYKCNAIALLTIEEALVQVQVGMASAHEESMKDKLMKVLEELHLKLSNRDNFSSAIYNYPEVAEKLELKKLQYTGKGMEYLKLLSKQQNRASALASYLG